MRYGVAWLALFCVTSAVAFADDLQFNTDWGKAFTKLAPEQFEGKELGATVLIAALNRDADGFVWHLSGQEVKNALNANEEYKVEKLKKQIAANPKVQSAMKSLVDAASASEFCFWAPEASHIRLAYKVSYPMDEYGAEQKQVHKGFAVVGNPPWMMKQSMPNSWKPEVEYLRTLSFVLYNGGTDGGISVRSWDRVSGCFKDLCWAPTDDVPDKIKEKVSDVIDQQAVLPLRWCFSGGFVPKKLQADKGYFQKFYLPKKVRLEIWDAGRKAPLWTSDRKASTKK